MVKFFKGCITQNSLGPLWVLCFFCAICLDSVSRASSHIQCFSYCTYEWLAFSHCQENSQANRKLITAFLLHLWPKVQQEPYNKVAFLRTVGRPVKFEKTIFWFCCNALLYWATLTTSIITVNYFYVPPHSIKHLSLWL